MITDRSPSSPSTAFPLSLTFLIGSDVDFVVFLEQWLRTELLFAEITEKGPCSLMDQFVSLQRPFMRRLKWT